MIFLWNKGKPRLSVFQSGNHLFSLKVSQKIRIINYPNNLSVSIMSRTFTRWRSDLLSIQRNVVLSNGKNHIVENWRRGSEVWWHPAKFWTHHLPPKLRLVLPFLSIISLELQAKWWVPQRWHMPKPCQEPHLRPHWSLWIAYELETMVPQIRLTIRLPLSFGLVDVTQSINGHK